VVHSKVYCGGSCKLNVVAPGGVWVRAMSHCSIKYSEMAHANIVAPEVVKANGQL
jgi:hypothetical protein